MEFSKKIESYELEKEFYWSGKEFYSRSRDFETWTITGQSRKKKALRRAWAAAELGARIFSWTLRIAALFQINRAIHVSKNFTAR